MNKKRKISQFEFSNNDLEVSFTYFYFLGHQISIGKDRRSQSKLEATSNENENVFIRKDRWSSDKAHELRSNFIDEVLIDYFCLDVKKIFNKPQNGTGSEVEFVFFEDGSGGYTEHNSCTCSDIARDRKIFKFKIGCRPFDNSDDSSEQPIECFLMKNGHLVVTLKFVNTNTIPAYDAVALIRQPDLIRVDPIPKQIGFLVKKSEEVIEKIEPYLRHLLEENKVEKIESGNCHGINKVPVSFSGKGDSNEDGLRSIPYVGTFFSFNDMDNNDIESLETSIERFTIAAARATPAFLNSFENPLAYLNNENRNVYIPGESIVYIDKRGWCIFDAGTQDSRLFYTNVIETTRLALLFTYSTQRTWYRYYRFLKDKGKPIIGALNQSVIDIIKKNSEDSWLCRHLKKIHNPELSKCDGEIANVTGFIAKARLIAPSSRTSRLFEAHMMSHTARAAVRRCEYICHLLEVEGAALQTTKHFSDSLGIAANHFRSIARQNAQIRLVVSLVGAILIPAIWYLLKGFCT